MNIAPPPPPPPGDGRAPGAARAVLKSRSINRLQPEIDTPRRRQSVMTVMPPALLSARPLHSFIFRPAFSRELSALGALVSNTCVTWCDFLRYCTRNVAYLTRISGRHTPALPKIAPTPLSGFRYSPGDATRRAPRFRCWRVSKRSLRNTRRGGGGGGRRSTVYSTSSGFRILQFSAFPRNRNRRLPNRIALATSIIPGLSYRPIGFRRDNDSPIRFSSDATAEVAEAAGESQFPERSCCNLRLKQRGGTTITDCIRSTERVIPRAGDAGIHRRIYHVHTRAPETRACVCARVSVKRGRVSACKSIVVATANPRATEWRVKALPKPPGMTESGDEKKRIGAENRERRREKRGRERKRET